MPDLTDQIDIPWQDQPAVEPVDAPVVPPPYQAAPVDMGVDSSGQTAGDRWWKTNAAYGQMLRAQEENLRLARTRDAVSAAEEFIRRKEVERLVKSGAPLEVAEFQTRARSLKPMAAPIAPPQLMTLGGSPAVPAHTVKAPLMYIGDSAGEADAMANRPSVQVPATPGTPGILGIMQKGSFKPLPAPKTAPMSQEDKEVIARRNAMLTHDVDFAKDIEKVQREYAVAESDRNRAIAEKNDADIKAATTRMNHAEANIQVLGRQRKDLQNQLQGGKPPETLASESGVPKVGEVRKGYRFKGGNPADKNSWELVK